MNPKHLSAILLCAVLLTGCGNGDSAETTATTTVQTTAAPVVVTTAPNPNEVDPNEMVDLENGITEKMYGRAILNEGNPARLAAAMKKAQNGEKVTVGVIGGSITQGSSASNQNNCYASLFKKWWEEKFPSAEINFVNAGIGGTNSYLGVHRVDEQLLAHNPDVVIVEFSVNDTDKTMNKYSYDSLVRKILSHETNPAVMLLFTTQENGSSLQDVHKEIGAAYDLPMISYRELCILRLRRVHLTGSLFPLTTFTPTIQATALSVRLLTAISTRFTTSLIQLPKNRLSSRQRVIPMIISKMPKCSAPLTLQQPLPRALR